MKPKSKILVIAGSDSSGGAGIQGDIKTITSLGGYAMTAITAITVQSTTGEDVSTTKDENIKKEVNTLDDDGHTVTETSIIHTHAFNDDNEDDDNDDSKDDGAKEDKKQEKGNESNWKEICDSKPPIVYLGK